MIWYKTWLVGNGGLTNSTCYMDFPDEFSDFSEDDMGEMIKDRYGNVANSTRSFNWEKIDKIPEHIRLSKIEKYEKDITDLQAKIISLKDS